VLAIFTNAVAEGASNLRLLTSCLVISTAITPLARMPDEFARCTRVLRQRSIGSCIASNRICEDSVAVLVGGGQLCRRMGEEAANLGGRPSSMNLRFNRLSRARSISVRGGLPCSTANDRESFLLAFRLIYRAYLRDGLTQPNSLGLRYTPHQLSDDSSVFMVRRDDRVVGTLTFIEDGELGLPIESLYGAEISRLRRREARVAELSCLALEDTETMRCFSVLRGLLRAALELAKLRQVELLTVCIHPRNLSFYERRLKFTQFGPLRYCPWVCDQPAIAMFRRLSRYTVRSDEFTNGIIRMADMNGERARGQIREYFSRWAKDVAAFSNEHWQATSRVLAKDSRIAAA
jgi:hypothetical protein